MSSGLVRCPPAPDPCIRGRGGGTTRKQLTIEKGEHLHALYGEFDRNLHYIEEASGADIKARGNRILIEGDERAVDAAVRAIKDLEAIVEAGHELEARDVRLVMRAHEAGPAHDVAGMYDQSIAVASNKKRISPKTANQKAYVEAIQGHDIVFGVGPAGTGKTYLAMAMAVSALVKKEVNRIILTRPAVEAGERLGFLPGDIYAKVHPYLRPLYDALYDMMDAEKAGRLVERGTIEVAPLAYMRGRTLNDSFIILDEAQNTTSEQMKMFLTRMGFGSRTVVTGDITQVDLPAGRASGLIEVMDILSSVKGISFVRFTDKDVVRHSLVQKIIKAYQKHEDTRHGKPKG